MTAHSTTQIEDLLSENNMLRDELGLLRQENDILRRRLENATGGDRPTPMAAQRPRELDASDTGSNWRSAEPNPREARALRSAILGRGKRPEELPQPNPARPAGSAPALDLGYVNRVGETELDALPYGLIVLDSTGEVAFYNETEARLAGFERNRVVGRNFFEEVAPCTQVKGFQGRFEQFVKGKLGKVTFFDFAFHFEAGTQQVTIAFSQGRRPGLTNVMLIRK